MRSRNHRPKALAVLAAGMIGLSQPALATTYTTRDGRRVDLPGHEIVLDKPAISPDGRQVAYIRAAGHPVDGDDPQPSEVVITDLRTGAGRVLVHSGAGSEWYLRPVVRITFAADGHYLFAERTYPGTSHSVHKIDLVTGNARLVGWGVDIAVLRDGPWRGDLLMAVHTCYRAHPGCDYPVHVVTPAGKSVYVVPGTDGADRASRTKTWLANRGWRAW